MDQKYDELLNNQINKELISAYNYLDFSNFFESIQLMGYANYYAQLAKKKISIAMMIYAYMYKYRKENNVIDLFQKYGNLEKILRILQFSRDSEIDILENIKRIHTDSLDDKDYTTAEFVQHLITLKQQQQQASLDMIDDFLAFENPKQLDQKYLKN